MSNMAMNHRNLLSPIATKPFLFFITHLTAVALLHVQVKTFDDNMFTATQAVKIHADIETCQVYLQQNQTM
jgi:hypothetical protein